MGACEKQKPTLIEIEKGHQVACFLYENAQGGDHA